MKRKFLMINDTSPVRLDDAANSMKNRDGLLPTGNDVQCVCSSLQKPKIQIKIMTEKSYHRQLLGKKTVPQER